MDFQEVVDRLAKTLDINRQSQAFTLSDNTKSSIKNLKKTSNTCDFIKLHHAKFNLECEKSLIEIEKSLIELETTDTDTNEICDDNAKLSLFLSHIEEDENEIELEDFPPTFEKCPSSSRLPEDLFFDVNYLNIFD